MLDHLRRLIDLELPKLPLTGRPDEVYAPMRYLMGLGGKRFRPMLTLLAAGMCGADPERFVRVALAVEVFHNFSLMHDDIMDQAPMRRGQPTVHMRWNEPVAILSGDAMLVKAYELLLEAPPAHLPQVLGAFNRCALGVVEGQQWDMNFEQHQSLSEGEYLEMIELKTAVLVAFALQLGALLPGASDDVQQEMYEAGRQMGLGFQLYDDYLDAFGTEGQTGKQVGGDILAGKKTMLWVKTTALLEGADAEAFTTHYGNRNGGAESIAVCQKLMQQCGAAEAVKQASIEGYEQGLHLLEGWGGNEQYRGALIALATQLMYRQN